MNKISLLLLCLIGVNAIKVNKQSIPACTSIECKTETAADHGPDGVKRDYFVPNFGLDHEIIVS